MGRSACTPCLFASVLKLKFARRAVSAWAVWLFGGNEHRPTTAPVAGVSSAPVAWIWTALYKAAPGDWAVPKLFHGWAFRLELIPGGVRVTASMSGGEPAVWVVPAC